MEKNSCVNCWKEIPMGPHWPKDRYCKECLEKFFTDGIRNENTKIDSFGKITETDEMELLQECVMACQLTINKSILMRD